VTRRDRQKRKGEIKTGFKVTRLSDERICSGREFQLLGWRHTKSTRSKRKFSTGRNRKKVTISRSQTCRVCVCLAV